MRLATPKGDQIPGRPMSDDHPTARKPLVLRVEISAEQAASLAPLLGLPPALPALPAVPGEHHTEIHDEIAPQRRISADFADARLEELTARETDLEQREAVFEADVQFREDRMERWRSELEELEQRLDRRERDLVSYVDQLQGAMSGNDDAWWARPAGGDGGVR
jgi:UDP:flavonoid glycosyltransferase YjiC (YdhE family)